MRHLFLVLCLISLNFTQVNGSPQRSSNALHLMEFEDDQANCKCLMSVGKSYIDLLNQIGALQNLSHEETVLSLCAPNCRKIVNGSLWFQGIENFVPQLLSTGQKVGFWKLEPLDIIPGKDERTVVVRFLVHTEKAGTWNTLVILRCDDKLLITEINEIFNSYEGAL
jgi:hypothetical protein